jgi:GNAT superfamily N-acetyltransferase
MSSTDAVIRPLVDVDVPAADAMAFAALAEVGERFGFDMGTRDATRVAFGQARVRHMAGTDPDGAFVAELAGEIVGIALALVRGPLWFLSLLAVRQGLQGQGIGKRLLDASLECGADCPAGMIVASPDPKALRRYSRAGFALRAGFEATGKPDLSELPAGHGVADGDWDRDAGWVDDLITGLRGATWAPELSFLANQNSQLLVLRGPTKADRAYAILHGKKLVSIGGGTEAAATRVLWAAMAQMPAAVVGNLTSDQQWAIEVCMDARLSLALTDTVCTRGTARPGTPYLVSGLFG